MALSLLVSRYWPGVLVALCTGLKFLLTSRQVMRIPPRPELHSHGQTEATEIKSQVLLISVTVSWHIAMALSDMSQFLEDLLSGFQCAVLLIKFIHYDCGCLLDSIPQRASCFLMPSHLSCNGWASEGRPRLSESTVAKSTRVDLKAPGFTSYLCHSCV